jgi:hypothetical protein
MGEPFVVREVVVAEKDRERFPTFRGVCPLCEGRMSRELLTLPIERDYDEASAVVFLRELPALVCEDCRSEWVRDDILERYDPRVEEQFELGLLAS